MGCADVPGGFVGVGCRERCALESVSSVSLWDEDGFVVEFVA